MTINRQRNILHRLQSLYNQAIGSNNCKDSCLELKDFVNEYKNPIRKMAKPGVATQ